MLLLLVLPLVEGQPLQRIFYELYRDKAAFEAHEAAPHTRIGQVNLPGRNHARPHAGTHSRRILRPHGGCQPVAVSACQAGGVPLTVSAAAARAAVSVAADLGVACAEPVVLADGANVIVHLSPSAVVAKVAASTAAVRADVGAWLKRELDLAVYLAGAGIPVLVPSGEVPATVHRGDGHVMSFWTYRRLDASVLPDEATIGSMLRDLHAALRPFPLRPFPGSPPVLAPLGDIPAFLARPQTLLSATDVSILTEIFSRLAEDLAPASNPGQVLHGDAGASNLMIADGGWIWYDFEDTCRGPVAWDLAATTASPRLDRSRILAAYGDAVDEAQLDTCQQLRRLHLTIWYALYAERLPECRQRATELLATWRPSA